MKVFSKTPEHHLHTQGFGLVELLTVIAILSILTSIGVGALGGARQGAVDQRDKRNAQEIASLAAIANAAGAHFLVEGDERATIENLQQGCAPNHGPFKGRTFQLPSLGEPEIVGAMRYLAIRETELQFRLDGSS